MPTSHTLESTMPRYTRGIVVSGVSFSRGDAPQMRPTNRLKRPTRRNVLRSAGFAARGNALVPGRGFDASRPANSSNSVRPVWSGPYSVTNGVPFPCPVGYLSQGRGQTRLVWIGRASCSRGDCNGPLILFREALRGRWVPGKGQLTKGLQL